MLHSRRGVRQVRHLSSLVSFEKNENKETYKILVYKLAPSVFLYWDPQLAICKIFINDLSFIKQTSFLAPLPILGGKSRRNTYDVVLVTVPYRDVFFANDDPPPSNPRHCYSFLLSWLIILFEFFLLNLLYSVKQCFSTAGPWHLLKPGPRLINKYHNLPGPRSYKGWEPLS
jgi:hypothetical protein